MAKDQYLAFNMHPKAVKRAIATGIEKGELQREFTGLLESLAQEGCRVLVQMDKLQEGFPETVLIGGKIEDSLKDRVYQAIGEHRLGDYMSAANPWYQEIEPQIKERLYLVQYEVIREGECTDEFWHVIAANEADAQRKAREYFKGIKERDKKMKHIGLGEINLVELEKQEGFTVEIRKA